MAPKQPEGNSSAVEYSKYCEYFRQHLLDRFHNGQVQVNMSTLMLIDVK